MLERQRVGVQPRTTTWVGGVEVERDVRQQHQDDTGDGNAQPRVPQRARDGEGDHQRQRLGVGHIQAMVQQSPPRRPQCSEQIETLG